MARRSFLATGGSGAVPIALTTRRTSKPSVSILWSPVSMIRAEIWTPPARLAVGATTKVSCRRLRAAPSRPPTRPPRRSAGPALQHQDARVAPPPRSRASRTARAPPARGPGAAPSPSRRYLSTEMAQPAYCDAMQETAGWSVHTVHAGPWLLPDRERGAGDITRAAHADLGQRQAGIQPASRLHPGIDHPRPAPEVVSAIAIALRPARPCRSAISEASSFMPSAVVTVSIPESLPSPSSARSPLYRRYRPAR